MNILLIVNSFRKKKELYFWLPVHHWDVKHICETVLSIESTRKCLIGLLMNQTNGTASQMTFRKYNTSVLMQKSLADLKTFDWFTLVSEFKTKFPELMASMLSLIHKIGDQNLYTIMEKVVPRQGNNLWYPHASAQQRTQFVSETELLGAL